MPQNEQATKRQDKTCLLCGQRGFSLYEQMTDRLFATPGSWNLFYCVRCSLIWLSPAPSDQEIYEAYKNYFTHQAPDSQSCRSRWKKRMAPLILRASFGYQHLLHEKWPRLAGRAIALLPGVKNLIGREVSYLKFKPEGKLLEIGCGNGDFLAQMKAWGWEVVGVEPDPVAANIARQKHQLRVIAATAENASLPADSFDAVIMHHVIEHHPDPARLLRVCWHVLKTNGQLVIITPNINSLGHRHFGANWVHLDPPRHFQLFSPPALIKLTEKAGFQVHQVRSIIFFRFTLWTWITSQTLKKKGPYSSQQESLRINWRALAFFALEKVLSLFNQNWGEEILLRATKTTETAISFRANKDE